MTDNGWDFTAFVWALDYCRAVNELPWWRKILFRIIMGKYAYHEYLGVRHAIVKAGYDPDFEYGCRDCDYHKDEIFFKEGYAGIDD